MCEPRSHTCGNHAIRVSLPPTQVHTITHRVEYHGSLSQRVQALADLPAGGNVLVDANTFKGINGHLNQLGVAVISSLGKKTSKAGVAFPLDNKQPKQVQLPSLCLKNRRIKPRYICCLAPSLV